MIAEPPLTSTDADPTLVLAVFAALAAAALVAAAVQSVRTRDVLAIAACAGALVCSLNEPIFDLLGKIVYAPENHIAYTNFDREIPWFLVLGYVPWVGLLPYAISRWIAGGVSRRALHLVALGSFASVVVVELVGTSLEVWTYYGEPPLKYIGVAPQMAAMPLVGGLLLHAAGGLVPGQAGRLAVGLAVPAMALPLTYGATSWPLYLGLYAEISKPLQWLAALAALGLAAATVAFVSALARRLEFSGT